MVLIENRILGGESHIIFFLGLQSSTSHWFLGSIDRIHTGLIPANYVQPVREPATSSITLRPQTPFNSTVN
jgi:hypothetical protein